LRIGVRFLAAGLFAEAGLLADVADRAGADAVAAFADIWPPNEKVVKSSKRHLALSSAGSRRD
jgi:hypothetical protein